MLCAAYKGYSASTVEINPFLVWFGRAKTSHYSASVISATHEKAFFLLNELRRGNVRPVTPPPIHNIERWWKPEALSFLCHLKGAIDSIGEDDGASTALLRIAFCRTMMKLSNAAFNHQSMSFKAGGVLELFSGYNPVNEYRDIFRHDLNFVLASAAENPLCSADVVGGDARYLDEFVEGPFDLALTSPPYANRMSYIRELRPYMYWLGYLRKAKEAGELDWNAIGGTWGVATSRLLSWERNQASFRPAYLKGILNDIACAAEKNGELLSKYIDRYFEDIWQHLKSLCSVLSHGSRVHYIVGNSTFYGILLPTERVYAHMLSELGFSDVTITAIRKRNSKKELFEFDVSAVYKTMGQKRRSHNEPPKR